MSKMEAYIRAYLFREGLPLMVAHELATLLADSNQEWLDELLFDIVGMWRISADVQAIKEKLIK